MEKGKVTVLRYNPEIDQKPHYETYEFPFKKGMTVLDVAFHIYENIDGAFSFSYCCRNSHCGLCGAKINGKPGLMCRESATPEMILEPLDNMTVIRDLTIDRDEYEQRKDSLRLFLERTSSPKKVPEKVDMEAHKHFKVASRCVECFSCVSGCPVIKENPNEFLGPAGFVQMARHAFDPRDELNRAIIAASGGVYNCVTCRKCSDVCPHEIAPEENIELLRAQLVKSGRAPEAVSQLVNMIKETNKAIMPTKGKETFLEQNANQVKSEIGLFVGCNIDRDPRLMPIATAVVKVLEHLGQKVAVPGSQVCCGTPLKEVGAFEQLEELALKNIKAFVEAGCKKVITICSGCGHSAKTIWPELYKKATGQDMPFEVLDYTEFITQLAPAVKEWQEVKMKVTYHDSCSLKRGQGVFQEPREILKSVPGLNFVEMQDADSCCGGGGGVRINNYDMAQRISKRKVDKIKEVDVDAVVTCCPTCMKHLTIGLKLQKERNVKVIHVATILARALGLE
ncbi:MAG: fumarate reductase (CoM/CoB) subunit TfrB [Dehalobacterium sp.]